MAGVVDGIPVGGSIGKITYSRNRYGAYTRRRTKPVNPNSPRQNSARSRFRAAVALWQSLTSIQRLAWENWAAITPWINRAGEAVNLSGQAAFIRSISAFQAGGLASPSGVALTPPVQNDVGTILVTGPTAGSFDIDPVTQTIGDLIFGAPAASNSSGIANGKFIVEMTPGQNPSRRFPGSRWASIAQPGGGFNSSFPWGANVIDLTGITIDMPWALSVGQVVWFRFRGVGDLTTFAERRVTTQVIVGPLAITLTPP